MPFEKGRQKTGGRKKGVKNKITRLKVKSYLETAGVSPVGEIIKLIPIYRRVNRSQHGGIS